MADYKRMVSYMYQYEDGVKRQNVGYARIEARNGECKITMHMQLPGILDGIFPTYLIYRKSNDMDLIYLGDSILKNQALDSRLMANAINVMDSGHTLSEMGGILLFLNDNEFFASEWDDNPIVLKDVLQALNTYKKDGNNFQGVEESPETRQAREDGNQTNTESNDDYNKVLVKEDEIDQDSQKIEQLNVNQVEDIHKDSDMAPPIIKETNLVKAAAKPNETYQRRATLINRGNVPREEMSKNAGLKELISRNATTKEEPHKEANIREAIPGEAGLKKAIPREAGLKKAVKSEAKLNESVPREAGLKKAVTSEAKLNESVPRETGLKKAVKSEAKLNESIPREAGLKKAVTSEGKLIESAQREADLMKAVPREAGLKETVPREVGLKVPREVNLNGSVPREVGSKEHETVRRDDFTSNKDIIKEKSKEAKKALAFDEAIRTDFAEAAMFLEEELAVPVYKLPRGWKTVERTRDYGNAYKTASSKEAIDKKTIEASGKVAFGYNVNNDNSGTNKEGTQGEEELNNSPLAERLFNSFPRVYPFEDNEIFRCVKIEPKDVGLLPAQYWLLSNNSFLLHGFYTYNHIVLANIRDGFGDRYLLGIPGIYHNREKLMARMFGFDNFKSIRKRELRPGDFGYWSMVIVME